MVPSLRVKDNVVQAICVAVGAVLGVVIGLIVYLAIRKDSPDVPAWLPLVGGAVGGAILATLASGLVLMVLGWKRALTKKPGGPGSR